MILGLVGESAAYKTLKFTSDDYFILEVGFGNFVYSKSFPTGTVNYSTSLATMALDYRSVRVSCSLNLTIPNLPDSATLASALTYSDTDVQ